MDEVSAFMMLNPVSFTYKDGGEWSFGFIAQEVEKIYPDIVEEEDGIKMISYDSFIPVMIEIIRLQEEKIAELEVLVRRRTE